MRSARRTALLVALAAPLGVLVAGCGSSSSGGHPSAAADTAAPPICTQVADVLGDGPDPDSDPVGYAEAQIGPLAALHPGNPKLQTALTTLAAAYRSEFTNGITKASKQQVKAATKQITAICPDAAS
jgi:hypothetical protein